MLDHPIIFGFTGSRHGITAGQRDVLRGVLRNDMRHVRGRPGMIYGGRPTHLHHGDCVGADHEAHILAVQCGLDISIHPPIELTYRALNRPYGRGMIYEPKAYLTRNRAIVEACDVLIACPLTEDPVLRSGTWATIRYAELMGKPVIKISQERYK